MKHIRACVLIIAMKAGEGAAPPCVRCGEPQVGGIANDERQAGAFFDGWDAGWQRLHDAMMRDPNLQQHFVANVVTARMPAAEYLASLQKPPTQETSPVAAPVPVAPEATSAGVSLDGIDLSKPIDLDVMKSLLSDAEKKASAPMIVDAEIMNQRVRREVPKAVRSMTPEEIAQAMVPVLSGPSNGAR